MAMMTHTRKVKGGRRRSTRSILPLLSGNEQQVKRALESLSGRSKGAIPSLREVQEELGALGSETLAINTISNLIKKLEETGHIYRRLEVVS